MSTRCTIAIKEDERYSAIYCRYSGDNEGNGVGPNLREYYTSYGLVKNLVELGDLSAIEDGQAIAYHRDRGESWARCCPEILPSLAELRKHAMNQDADYLYVFDEGAWVVTKMAW